jgi:hypothetical protein
MIGLVECFTIAASGALTIAAASYCLNLLGQSRDGHSDSSRRAGEDKESGRPSAGAWHTPRQDRRHRVSCRLEYVISNGLAIGTLLDMSRQGWRVKGEQPVAKDSKMTIHAFLSDSPTPTTIEEAIVRWTDGVEFGIELTRISPESARILSDYRAAHFPAPEPTPFFALSPYSYN